MTDKINSLTIALDSDIRDDDIEVLVSALYQMKRVVHVQKNVTDPSLYVAESRVKCELTKKIYDALEQF
jgi:hypothetical protein